MDTLLRAILAAPAADTLGGDEELVIVENTQIKRKQVADALDDMRVARFNATGPVIPDRIGTQRYMPYLLAQSGVPVGIAPNGTIATNGAVTLGTALPTTYSGGIWLRFPANAVVGDSTGGIYWCVMSSTTVGTVYAGKIDTASAFTPYIGSTAGGAVTGSNSAYTQDTALITLTNVTVPAGAMGVNGAMRITVTRFVVPNNANSKTLTTKYGASFFGINNAVTTTLGQGYIASIRNRGVANRQVAAAANGDVGTGACSYLSIDSATDQPMTVICQIATATDYVILEGFTVEVLPS